jgi:hypothetical protein
MDRERRPAPAHTVLQRLTHKPRPALIRVPTHAHRVVLCAVLAVRVHTAAQPHRGCLALWLAHQGSRRQLGVAHDSQRDGPAGTVWPSCGADRPSETRGGGRDARRCGRRGGPTQETRRHRYQV